MADTTLEANGAPIAAEHGPHVHIASPRVLGTVLAALLVLTFLTVAATWHNFGVLNLWIAMGIATLKASLVVLYFMHMRYDRPMNAIVFMAALLFVALFVSLALLDSLSYRPELIPGYAPAVHP